MILVIKIHPVYIVFEDGIPMETWGGRIIHGKSYPGDSGVQLKNNLGISLNSTLVEIRVYLGV